MDFHVCPKKRFLISEIIAVFFALSLIFPMGFPLTLPRGGTPHVYWIRFSYLISMALWLYSFWRILIKRRKESHVTMAYIIVAVLFGVYYVGLSVARYLLGTNIIDSFGLFLRILLMSAVFLPLTMNHWAPSRLFRLFLIIISLLSAGYWCTVIIYQKWAVAFPDTCTTYIALASSAIPVLLFSLSQQEKLNLCRSMRYMAIFSLVSCSVLPMMVGSRAAFVLIIIDWIGSLAAFSSKENTAYFKTAGVSLLLSLAIGLTFYSTDLLYSRSGIERAATQNIPAVSQSQTTEEIQQAVQEIMIQREQAAQEGFSTGALYHNPTELSNYGRLYCLKLAKDRLQDDWLFSLKGETFFELDALLYTGVSGTHNFIVDYLLAFGAVGTVLLAIFLLIPAVEFFRRVKTVSTKRFILWGFLLSMAALFAFGMTQEIFSSEIPLAWLFLLVAFWYQSVSPVEETNTPPKLCMLVTSGVINDSRVIREATLAAENGFDTMMIGRYVAELGEESTDWNFSCKRIRIPRSRGGIPAKILERTRLGVALACTAVRYKPDIIHCNDFDTLPFGYLAALICGSGLVYDAHELWTENDLVSRHVTGKKFAKALERYLIHRCDAVISVSHAAGKWLRDTYHLNNLTIVTNCPLTTKTTQLPKNDGFELLCHGMFSPDRGYEELIACASLVAKEQITIRIRGYGDRTEYYHQLVKNSGQSNIILCGKVPAEQVSTAATASHVGIALTRPISKSFELTVSNKLFEYIAAGLPVILSNVPEHRMLNEKYHFGIILDEMTAEDLAKAAIRLKMDKQLYNKLAQNAKNASKDLCFQREGMKLISVYQSIIKEKVTGEFDHETSFA